ncbi:uncharacterized protein CLUP02_03835 [Colletotrichum lupini]|uniref:Uncharacterized protein n=1 Tax=Colletotrichum lupini TaxID=145971 RepID=A0A9Q8SJL2_9PEZI|nr:uncharacterized protein CLUP02_03835 [Colletotrichum lupini]UQC78358.1 hypothetical protein CLUP02_03835 [Colletotrichum lupini]
MRLVLRSRPSSGGRRQFWTNDTPGSSNLVTPAVQPRYVPGLLDLVHFNLFASCPLHHCWFGFMVHGLMDLPNVYPRSVCLHICLLQLLASVRVVVTKCSVISRHCLEFLSLIKLLPALQCAVAVAAGFRLPLMGAYFRLTVSLVIVSVPQGSAKYLSALPPPPVAWLLSDMQWHVYTSHARTYTQTVTAIMHTSTNTQTRALKPSLNAARTGRKVAVRNAQSPLLFPFSNPECQRELPSPLSRCDTEEKSLNSVTEQPPSSCPALGGGLVSGLSDLALEGWLISGGESLLASCAFFFLLAFPCLAPPPPLQRNTETLVLLVPCVSISSPHNTFLTRTQNTLHSNLCRQIPIDSRPGSWVSVANLLNQANILTDNWNMMFLNHTSYVFGYYPRSTDGLRDMPLPQPALNHHLFEQEKPPPPFVVPAAPALAAKTCSGYTLSFRCLCPSEHAVTEHSLLCGSFPRRQRNAAGACSVSSSSPSSPLSLSLFALISSSLSLGLAAGPPIAVFSCARPDKQGRMETFISFVGNRICNFSIESILSPKSRDLLDERKWRYPTLGLSAGFYLSAADRAEGRRVVASPDNGSLHLSRVERTRHHESHGKDTLFSGGLIRLGNSIDSGLVAILGTRDKIDKPHLKATFQSLPGRQAYQRERETEGGHSGADGGEGENPVLDNQRHPSSSLASQIPARPRMGDAEAGQSHRGSSMDDTST